MEAFDLDFLFHPQSIAIAGVRDASKFNAGLMFYKALSGFGYPGRIYPLNPNGGEVMGQKIYTSLKEVPGQVDYVISAVPSKSAPQLITDAAAKGVKALHFFTSGFGEIENANGKKLQEEILRIARQGGIRVVGPNCLGLYCPKGGLTFNPDVSKESGPVGMISQSGGNASHALAEGNSRGVRFSKVISMGNGADLNESDYLEYLTNDPDTKIITAYIEGIKNGPRFLKAVKNAAKIKPVIIFKVGGSEAGAEAAVSHTTAMAGSSHVWEGLLAQAGAIQVYSIEEMMDMVVAFLYMHPPEGKSSVIIGVGGGASVILADEFSNAGLSLPKFSKESRQKLISLYSSEAGRIFKNPVDINNFESPETFAETIQIIEAEERVHSLVVHIAFDHFGLVSEEDKDFMVGTYQSLILSLKNKIKKPTAVILHSFAGKKSRQMAFEIRDALTKEGFAVFLSIRSAAVALNRYVEHHRRLKPGFKA
ncbi:MAG: CoA-binding protein [Syntrophales bacterium]|nr:CoA-binding protein [Syntrophales bacterium]MDY0045564.1 CoA-binding protein [Syntrophales bacterium]